MKKMKKVKRILILSLVVVFAMTFAVACGGGSGGDSNESSESGGDITLSFWCHIDNVWNEQQEKIIADFEAENPGIKIKLEAFPYDDFEAKTQTSLINKSGGADIYSLWGGWAVDYASTGVFSPVPEEFIAEIKADSYEPVLGAFEYEGQYYGLPLEFNNEYGGMLVSVPLFKENGLSYPTTWNEMISAGKKATKAKGNTFEIRGFDFPAWDSLTYTWLSMILSSGGEYMDGDQFNFDNPIAIDTMKKLVDYVKKDKLTDIDGITNAEEQEPYQKFFLGEALMVPRGPWVVPEGPDEFDLTYGEDFEFVAMPFYGPEKVFAAETGWGLAVNAASENQEAAWKFVEFWSQKDRLLEYDIACGMIPPYKSLAQDPEFVKDIPYMEPIINILDGGRFIGYFNTDILKEAVSDMFTDIYLNDTPITQAVKDLDDLLNNG